MATLEERVSRLEQLAEGQAAVNRALTEAVRNRHKKTSERTQSTLPAKAIPQTMSIGCIHPMVSMASAIT